MTSLSIRTQLTLWYTAVLLAILLLVSALSYSVLRWSLMRGLDTSLLTVARVTQNAADAVTSAGSEAALREILGPEFYDKYFQLNDAQGRPRLRSTHLRDRSLPLSDQARQNAAHDTQTFETVDLPTGERVRLLTLPIVNNGRVAQVLQIGMPLHRAHQILARYLETLVVVVPFGVGLAAVGGAIIARAALKPVDEMSRTARRITAEDLSRRIQLRGTGDELDHLAGTLNVTLARLEDAFAQMRRFTADAAHELRTPLTALKGGIEVALRAARSSEEYRQVLQSSLEEAERLICLSEDLLLLSRSTAGIGAPWTRVDLEAIVLDVLDVGARLARDKELAIRLNETAPAVVVADGVALRRAVRNLVENAVKYTPAGGKVELSLSCADGTAAIAVQDTGVGIDPADGERIFQPFVRLDTARAREAGGAGLGLAIARSIVISHGGTLSLESAHGAGSRFTIRLPLA